MSEPQLRISKEGDGYLRSQNVGQHNQCSYSLHLFEKGNFGTRDPAEDLAEALRCCRQAVFQNHVTCPHLNVVMAGSVSQVQTDGPLGLLENHIATIRHSANLFIAGLLSIVLRARR
jgi:hypothetical protein